MPVQHLKACVLNRKNCNAFCSGCGERVADAKEDALWTIWTSDMTYCPVCAKSEGNGPDDY